MPVQPDIRYVTSRDGTRLAIAVWGTGRPAVAVLLHLGDNLELPGIATRHWCHAFSPYLSFARYDGRGCGLSDRHGGRVSLDTCVQDLEAAVDALGPEPVVLFGLSHAAAVAVQFAALHPERVSRLIIYGGFARGRLKRGADVAHTKEAKAILEVIQVAFGDDVSYRAAFRRTLNSRFFPSASPQQLDEVDAACPTLVFHARGDLLVPFDEGRRLASLIPRARFIPLDDTDYVPLETNPHWPRVLDELHAFLGSAQAPAGSPRAGHALRALKCRTRAEGVLLATQLGLLR